MWQVFNKTVFAVERNWTRDKQGAHWWVVAIKATYDIDARGNLVLADEQTPPLLAPQYMGEDGASSLLWDSDLLAIKPSTDVLVQGHAHAPGGKPAESVRVALRVDKVEKQLDVYGNRVYYEGATGLTTTPPKPFVKQAIRYEYALGGADPSNPDPAKRMIDERNPIGRGYTKKASVLANTPAHTLEYPSGSRGAGPAGFGPIDPAWLPRRTLAGTYDAKWVESKKPLLPDDYDPAFANCAPWDQRVPGPLVGGEKIGLLNMNPEGTLVFELPIVRLSFTSLFGLREETHPSKLTSVLIEPDERRVALVWQSSLRVRNDQLEYLDQTRVEEA